MLRFSRYQRHFATTVKRRHVFFEIQDPKKEKHRIEIELRNDVVPKTARNFELLCTGEKGVSYKGCLVHRIIPGFMFQSGDLEGLDGRGGFGAEERMFNDENFKLTHYDWGIVSMANCGPNTNASQFFITFQPTPHLDHHHVVFGKVKTGYDFMREMQKYGTYTGKTIGTFTITDCGKFQPKKAEPVIYD